MITIVKSSLYRPLGLSLLIALGTVSCSTTPQNDSAQVAEETAPAKNTAETESRSYPVQNSDVVDVAALPTPPEENKVVLKPSAPTQYTVQKGDTLWDISQKFLAEPWFWPEIWYSNPQISNPHLIYPGDIITVFYVGGKPYLTVGDGPRFSGIDKLSPSIRSETIEQDELKIPIQAIQQLLIKPRIISKEELDNSPYIVGSRDNRLIYGAGDQVYVQALDNPIIGTKYSLFRTGNEYHDPVTDELLGYEVIQVGDGELIDDRQPATLDLTNSYREALRGDHLLPVEIGDHSTAFFPRAPETEINGKVISLFDAISQVGTYQVVTTNLGERDGIKRGHVVEILQAGRTVTDPNAKDSKNNKVQLPDEKAGIAMIFRTFDKVSYALIMNAQVPIRVGDSVASPR